MLLSIDVAKFRADGRALFAAGPRVFLADEVPPEYLTVTETNR